MQNKLSTLLHPLSLKDFQSHFKANKPFVIHHVPDELKDLRDLPLVSSIEELLELWPAQIQVHLPEARDEISAVDVKAEEAEKMFHEGMGLLFNDANLYSPILQEWVDQLKRDLGLSALTYGRSLIYVTPDGKGTAPHFDQNINFVLQIHGTKKWTLAENTSVINPMVRHTMGHPVDPEMMSYLEKPLMEKMPAKSQTFELKPGSLLFVPRGVWHETEADGHALALNFTFTAPTWADLFLSALRSRLVLSPEWRETADGNVDTFDSLLSEIKDDLPNWRAGNILEATEN